jgi:hypothetical protein
MVKFFAGLTIGVAIVSLSLTMLQYNYIRDSWPILAIIWAAVVMIVEGTCKTS